MNTTNQVSSVWHTLKTYTVNDPQTFWTMVQAVGVIVTLWFIWRQIKLQRVGNSIVSLSEIEDEWRSPVMAEARKEVCKSFCEGREIGSRSAEHVACFFETLGLYHQRKAFDSEVIWELYSSYVEHYWPMLATQISKIRKEDSTAYTHFEAFCTQMRKISKERNAPSNKSRESLLAFAQKELERR